MYVDIVWKRPLGKMYTVSVAYTSYPSITIKYLPNITWPAAPPLDHLTPAFRESASEAAPLCPEWIAEAPAYRIGLPIGKWIYSVRDNQFRALSEVKLTRASRQRRDARILDPSVRAAIRKQPLAQVIDELVHLMPTPSEAHELLALVVAVLIATDAYLYDDLVHAERVSPEARLYGNLINAERILPDSSILEGVVPAELTIEIITLANILQGIVGADIVLDEGTVLDEIANSVRKAHEALHLAAQISAEKKANSAAEFSDLDPADQVSRNALIQDAVQQSVRLVQYGALAMIQNLLHSNRLAIQDADILDEQYLANFAIDPWDEIWAIHTDGVDDIQVPSRDYDYEGRFGTIMDRATGRILEALTDPTVPDVIVRVPPTHPFPIGGEKRRRIVPLYALDQMMRMIEYFQELYGEYFPSMSPQQVLQLALIFIYTAVMKKLGGKELEPYYMRAYRLVRWYAEKALYDHGKYLIRRVYAPWVANFAYFTVNWEGQGVTFESNRIRCEGQGYLTIYLTTQIRGNLVIGIDGTDGVIWRKRSDQLDPLHPGMNYLQIDPDEPIQLVFDTTQPIYITHLEREGYWLLEYTITPIVESGPEAFEAWKEYLWEYYRKHHEGKTKGTRYFHLQG